MNNKDFYNSFAVDYNSMIPLEKQVESKVNFYKNFVKEKTKTSADLGAGSGADSIALAKMGLNVTAFEPSNEMIKQAISNFAANHVNVNLNNKRVAEIDDLFNESFDLVVSLGNTFANISRKEIEQSVNKVFALLKKEGTAIIQLLNYDKILAEKERIINITEHDDKQFIRFYDFISDKVNFNILSYNKNNFSDQQIITTEIFPYTKSFLETLIIQNDFSDLKFFGDIKLNPFNKKASPNLIIVLKK